MKTFDLRQAGAAEVVPLVDDVATLHLDLWARDRGFNRTTLSFRGCMDDDGGLGRGVTAQLPSDTTGPVPLARRPTSSKLTRSGSVDDLHCEPVFVDRYDFV